MNCGLHRVLLAPYGSVDMPCLGAERVGGDRVSSGALDRSHVEAECVPLQLGAADMECCVAMVALNAGILVSASVLANLADGVVSQQVRADAYPFNNIHRCRMAELEFRGPNGTLEVDPVVLGRPFQRFARHLRSASLALALFIFIQHLCGQLFLQSLLFSFSLRLLLMRNLWRLDEFNLGVLDRAENTLVDL